MSFLSVGFHYPIEQYIEKLLKITTDDCIMIFGVRQNFINLEDYKKYFKTVLLEKNSIKTKEQILILKDKL